MAGSTDTSELLGDSLKRSIVDNSDMLANAASSNHQSQLNNFARAAEVLSKRICEWDGSETVAAAEGYSRVSPTSQPFHLAQGMSEISGVIQNNQNQVTQGLMQLMTSIEGLKAILVASK